MMKKMMGALTAATVACSFLSGCGTAVWPSISADKNLAPNDSTKTPKCITNDYSIARGCALLTIEEISKLLESTGNFDRTAAYTALGLGTITGGVLAYQGSENILKGLAIISGGLLGLNSAVTTKQQRLILESSLKEVTCALRAAEALQASSISLGMANESFTNLNSLSPVRIASAEETLLKLRTENNFSTLAEGDKVLANFSQTKKAIAIEALTKSYDTSRQALNSAQSSTPMKLSYAVLDIRAKLRLRLSGLTTDPDDIIKAQSNRIVEMTGEVVRKRADLEKKRIEGGQNDNGASIASQQFLTNTAPIVEAFRDCTEPSVQREIEKQI